jgi:hypothetical protein
MMDVDEDLCEVHFKESDDYPTNGFTIEELIDIIANYAEKTYRLKIPTCHVASKTVTYNAGTPYLSFIESLLISDLDHVIFESNEVVIITCIEPDSSDDTFPTFKGNTGSISGNFKNTSDYDSYHFIGGDGKPVLQDYAYDGIKYQTPDQIETTPWEVRQEQRGDNTVTVSERKKLKYGPFGETFCVLEHKKKVDGGIPIRANPTSYLQTTLEETTTEYQYDNDQSLKYEDARLKKTIAKKEGYCYRYYNVFHAETYGIAWYLTEDLTVIDSTTYDGLTEKPSIYASACIYEIPFMAITDYVTEKTHEISYATKNEAKQDPDLIEGAILKDHESIKAYGVEISAYVGITDGSVTYYETRKIGWYSATEPPKDVLLNVAASLQDVSEIISVTANNVSKEQAFTSVTYNRIANSMVEVITEQGSFVSQTSTMDVVTSKKTIPAESAPAVPTNVRRQRLQLKTGELGEKKTVICKSFNIPTANRTDFENIAGIMQNMANKLHEPTTYTAIDKYDFVLPGNDFNGRVAIGFVIVEEGSTGYDISITTM